MKSIILYIIIIFITATCGCNKGSIDSTTFSSDVQSKTAIIEGRVGYFSPALSPNPDLKFPYPGGYQLAEFHWLTADTPQVNVSGWIYLDGNCGSLKNKYVRVDGTWNVVMNTIENKDYPYIIISVDSIWVVR